jgi:exodeoxyribonuclease VII large subunit
LKSYAEQIERLTGDFIRSKIKYLSKWGINLQYSVNKFSNKQEKRLNSIRHELKSIISTRTHEAEKTISKKGSNLQSLINVIQSNKYHYLNYLTGQIKYNSKKFITKQNERINLNEKAIRLLDPENILKRGYSISYSNGKLIKSVRQLQIDDELETLFSDGKSNSIIIKKEYNGNTENHL